MFGGTFDLVLFDVVRNPATEIVEKVPGESTTTYRFSKLSLSTAETLDNWVRERHITAVELATRKLPAPARDAAMAVATRDLPNLCWNSKYGLDLFNCIDGMTVVLAACVVQHHPNIDRNDLRLRLCLAENMQAMGLLLRKANNAGGILPFLAADLVPPTNREQRRKTTKKVKKLARKR